MSDVTLLLSKFSSGVFVMRMADSQTSLWGRYAPELILVLLATFCAIAPRAAAQKLSASNSTTAAPGGIAQFLVSLSTEGTSVAGTENTIAFDRFNTPIATASDGTPACSVNPAINKTGARFDLQPYGCTGLFCLRVHALILSTDNVTAIPNGAWLYKCSVNIASNAAIGTYPLTMSDVIASDPTGHQLPAASGVGSVVVVNDAPPPSGCELGKERKGRSWFLMWPVVLFAVALRRRPARLTVETAKKRLWIALLSAQLLASSAPAQTDHPIDAQGRWWGDQTTSGEWQARFNVDQDGAIGGSIDVQGLPEVGHAKAEGSLRQRAIEFGVIHRDHEQAVFKGTVDGATLEGTFSTSSGLTGHWEGGWGVAVPEGTNKPRRTPGKMNLPAAVVSGLAAGQPQDVFAVFDDAVIQERATRMREAARRASEDREILDFKATEFALRKADTLAALSPDDAEVLIEYHHLPLTALRLKSQRALATLLARPNVIGIYENAERQLATSWGIIGQPVAAAAGFTGQGTTVVNADAGVHYTLDLFGPCSAPGVPDACKIAAAVAPPGRSWEFASDQHPDLTTGVIVHVAPDTRIVSVDIIDHATGSPRDDSAIYAIEWAIEHRDDVPGRPIVAVNLELGSGAYTEPCVANAYVPSVANAKAAGIATVAVAGNNFYHDAISQPACAPNVVSIGASSGIDTVSAYSNRSNFLTLLAPGATCVMPDLCGFGTSFSTPHATGAIAVLRSEFPGDPVDRTIARMTNTAVPVLDAASSLRFGRLDLGAAVYTSPICTYDCDGQGRVTIDEVLLGVSIAFGTTPLSACPPFDSSGDGQIKVDEVLGAVNTSLKGCFTP